jgi:hypothetical protein
MDGIPEEGPLRVAEGMSYPETMPEAGEVYVWAPRNPGPMDPSGPILILRRNPDDDHDEYLGYLAFNIEDDDIERVFFADKINASDDWFWKKV